MTPANPTGRTSRTTGSQPGHPSAMGEGLSQMLGTANKAFKWAKQSINQISFGVKLGTFAKNLYSGEHSPKAMKLYAMFGGAFALTYANWQTPQTAQSLPQKIGSLAKAVAKESSRITGCYKLIDTVMKLVKKPQDYVVPMAFAVTMILASHFASPPE